MKFKVLLFLLFVQLAFLAHAQDPKVTGFIRDESNNPLPGVSILLKGTTQGTTSDANGMYSISAPPEAILSFSFIGYATQDVAVNNRSTIDVTMQPDVTELGEVVVVGYGQQKKVNLTGSVGSIQSDFLENRPITNASQALQGSVPGVFVNQSSGQPGSDGAQIRIRGIGTLNNTNPLILVDGIEAPIDNVDPNDIASISVLKDAASASIYGSRASNGVILITTKRGKFERHPSISYAGYFGTTEATRLPGMVTNSAQYMELRNEANANSGQNPTFTQGEIDFYKTNGPNTDWLNEIFSKGGIQQHNVTASGGGEKSSYLLSLGYLDQEGVTPATSYKRYNLRLNVDSKISNKLTIGSGLFLTRGDAKAPVQDLVNSGSDQGIIALALKANPLFPVHTTGGKLAGPDQNFASGFTGFGNPLVQSEFNRFNRLRDQLVTNAFAEYELVKDLKIKGTFAINYQTSNTNSFSRKGDVYDWRTEEEIVPSINAQRGRGVSHSETLNLTSWLQASYVKTFGDHKISGLLGFNQESSSYNAFGAGRTNFPSDGVQVLNAGNASTSTNYENATAWALRSYFGRITYDFGGKYLAEFNIRRDGSSRFGANNRWGTFPSVSAGWIISNENFMSSLSFLQLLKLRASWGQLGNQYASTNYPFAASVSVNSNYVFNDDLVSGAAQTTFYNPDIKWETTATTDIGLELGLLDRFSLEADYFVRNTEDILYRLPVPATAGGLEDPVVNAASVQNKGWEAAIKYDEKFGAFSFSIGFHVTNVKSNVLKIDPDLTEEKDRVISGNYILQRGEPINSIYGLKAIGIFQSQEEIDASPTQFGSYGPGDLKFQDIDNNGEIDDDDRVIIGREDPQSLFGSTINAAFKGFDLSAIIQGVSDFQSYGSSEYYSPFFNHAGLGAQWANRWTPQKPTDFPRIFVSTGPNVDRANSFWVQDRSFVRIKNIQVGYNFPSALLTRMKLQKLRVYLNGQNLLTVTDFQGFDPERPQGQSRGGAGYPVLKILTAGLNVTF